MQRPFSSKTTSLLASFALGAAFVAACGVSGARPAAAAPPAATAVAAPQPHRTLVFALTTGLEDQQTVNMTFLQAKLAADEKKVDVIVLVYGRAVLALDGAVGARSPMTPALVRDAMAAGVRVQVCANAMQKLGVPADKLDPPGVQVVPTAIGALVDYVAGGAAVVRY